MQILASKKFFSRLLQRVGFGSTCWPFTFVLFTQRQAVYRPFTQTRILTINHSFVLKFCYDTMNIGSIYYMSKLEFN